MAMCVGGLSFRDFSRRKELFTLMAEISLIFQRRAREQGRGIMKVIYGAAGMFVLLALGSGWQALMLTPTDLGNSYLIATSVLFSTAGLMIALGIVGQRIIQEIRNRPPGLAEADFAPKAPSAPTIAMPAPVVPAPAVQNPIVQAPVLSETMPQPVAPPISRPVAPILAGAAAGVAAGAVLGGAMRTPSESPADARLLEDFERDLFADIRSAAPEPEKVEPALPLAEARVPDPEPVVDEPELPAMPPIADVVLGEPEDSALPPPSREIASDTGEDDDLVLQPLPPLPSLGLPEPTPSEAEIRAIEDAAHADDDRDDEPAMPQMAEPQFEPAIELLPEPLEPPEPELVLLPPEPVSPTPGLIHDEDLAALSEAEADLAPLETLDVVGAYDSGGTRFTMYSDGSVTAKGEGVDRRFRSLDDLRAFIDGGMRE